MVKSPDQIDRMRLAGQLTAQVLEQVPVRPGMTTLEVSQWCEQFIVQELKARPASKGYNGFEHAVNTSVNHVVCHGIPSPTQVLKSGDIINVDVTVEKDGFIGDSSRMFLLGDVPEHARRLSDTCQQAMYKAIQVVKPGATLGDVGHAIETHAKAKHFTVVREFCGHGIGEQMHEEPQVLHYGKPGKGLVLKPGMTFTIEPMINQGRAAVKINKKDGWTVTTKDRRLSAQWEHTVLVTESGCDVLTWRQDDTLPASISH